MATPKLRFKEFDGNWTLNKIGDIASKVGSGSTPRGGAEAYTSEGIIFIRSQNVNNDRLLLNDVAYIPDETHNKMLGSKVIANDILLNITGASIGRSCVVPHDFIEANVNQHVCIIRTPNDDPVFVQSFLSSENGQNAIQAKQAGGGREGLNFQAIRSIDFHFPPSKPEQTKIASFLSAVDEKISQLTQKHELLSQYKQGMMQKLFSQQFRFKADDGSEFGEWEETTLGKLTKYFKGYAFKSESYKENGIRIIRVSDLGKDSIKYDNDAIYLEESESPNYENWVIKKGDIVITTVGSKPHLIDSAVGRPIYIKNDNEGLLNQNLLVLRPIDQSVAAYFIFSQLLGKKYLTHIETIQRGNANQSNITVKDLQEFKVFNTLKEEQTKIANFLSAIDQKIEVVAQQIEQAKQWKKGLLQQMFV